MGSLTATVAICTAMPAYAHVKWFAPYDVHEAPETIPAVLNPTMLAMVTASVLMLLIAAQIERTPLAARCTMLLDRTSATVQDQIEGFLRATTGAFFVSLWALGGLILTPELRTDSGWVSWLQFAIACGMFWRATLPVSAAAIVVLYVYGIGAYGLFHMMDYPIFLGLAAYHALSASPSEKWRALRPDVLRWSAAATLMWASVEKWAYPHWTGPLLDAHAGLTLGVGHSTFMIIAGIVEFGLAFGLLGTSLVRRASALVLLTMFTLAIFEFGKIDAIGHMMIIAILVALILDTKEDRARLRVGVAAAYVPALIGTVTFYYGAHAILLGVPH